MYLDKYARKRTAAHHRAKRTLSVCAEPNGGCAKRLFPTGKAQTVDKIKSTVFFYKENRISMSNI